MPALPFPWLPAKYQREVEMDLIKSLLAAVLGAFLWVIAPGFALAQSKPNIVFIMGDDIGMWNISAYRVFPRRDGRTHAEH